MSRFEKTAVDGKQRIYPASKGLKSQRLVSGQKNAGMTTF
jgi:hypothetical protein